MSEEFDFFTVEIEKNYPVANFTIYEGVVDKDKEPMLTGYIVSGMVALIG